MKPIIINSRHNFSINDVFNGYVNAFGQLRVCDFDVYDVAQKLEAYKWHEHHVWHCLHSYLHLKDRAYTHMICIGGHDVPTWLLANCPPALKRICLSVDDPHSFGMHVDRMAYWDTIFTNEANCADDKKVLYLPTAADTRVCRPILYDKLPDRYKSDLCFIGSLYPNRVQYLESIVPLVREYKLKMIVLGGDCVEFSKSSPLRIYFTPGVVPHDETIKFYAGAKIVPNFNRPPDWHPYGENLAHTGIPQTYANPRTYELSACRTFQIAEWNQELEYLNKTGARIPLFKDVKSFQDLVDGGLGSNGFRKKSVEQNYISVMDRDTYVHRAKKILKTLT